MSAQTISGVGVNLFGRIRQLYAWAVAIVGQDSNGNPAPIKVNSTGAVTVSTSVTTGNTSVQTSNTGTDWVALASGAATEVTLFNDTGIKLRVSRDAGATYIPLPDGASKTFDGISNANQLSVQRDDQSNSQVTIRGELAS